MTDDKKYTNHCTGCTDPDPFDAPEGRTHQIDTIEHQGKVPQMEVKEQTEAEKKFRHDFMISGQIVFSSTDPMAANTLLGKIIDLFRNDETPEGLIVDETETRMQIFKRQLIAKPQGSGIILPNGINKVIDPKKLKN